MGGLRDASSEEELLSMRNHAFRTICLAIGLGLLLVVFDCPRSAAQGKDQDAGEKQGNNRKRPPGRSLRALRSSGGVDGT